MKKRRTGIEKFRIGQVLIVCLAIMSCGASGAQTVQAETTGRRAFESIYDLDGADRLMAFTKPDGTTIRYEYGESGRLVAINMPKGRTYFKYDRNGNCVEVSNDTGRTQYFYNAINRLTKVSYDYPVLRKSVTYKYDPWGRTARVAVESPAGAEEFYTTYDYDILGRLTRIEADGREIRYAYDPSGSKVTRKLPDDITSVSVREKDGRAGVIEHARGKEILARFEYKYDVMRRLETAAETVLGKTVTVQYRYDAAGRLIAADYSDGRMYRYGYDKMGNRVFSEGPSGRAEAKYDGVDRLLEHGKTEFEYDANGNTAAIKGPDRAITLDYNAANRLERAKAGNDDIRYIYSAEGLLIGREVNGDSAYYVPDPRFEEWHPLADGEGRSYVWGGSPLAVIEKNGAAYLLSDRTGSVRVIETQSAGGRRTLSYSPFGDCENAEEPGRGSVEYRYGGLFVDPITKCYITPARAYMPAWGRFLQAEVVSYGMYGLLAPSGGYVYCRADPINFVDPNGREPKAYEEILDGFGSRAENYGALRCTEKNAFTRFVYSMGIQGEAVKAGLFSMRHQLEENIDTYQQAVDSYTLQGNMPMAHLSAGVGAIARATMEFTAGSSITGLGRAVDPTLTAGQRAWGGAVGTQFLWGSIASSAWNKTVLQKLEAASTEKIADAVQLRLGSRGLDSLNNLAVASVHNRWIQEGLELQRISQELKATPELVKNAAQLGALIAKDMKAGSSGPSQQVTQTNAGIPPPSSEATMDRKKIPPSSRPFPPPPPDKFGGAGVPAGDALMKLGGKWQPKGVKFDKAAEFFGQIGAIQGVSFDPEKKRLTLIGDGNPALPPVRLDDFVTALRVCYGHHPGEPDDPTFSLDPQDPSNPAGDWLNAVYKPNVLAGTHMGDVMFEADWVLKQYAFGVLADREGRITGKRTSSRPEYRSYMELLKEHPSAMSGGRICSRFWILPLEMKLARSGNTLVFTRCTMQVQTRRMDVVDGRLEDNPDTSDPMAEEFAAFFTSNYDELAREAPILEEVREAAKVVAIVKWLKEEGVGVNDFKIDWKAAPRSNDYVKEIHSLSITGCASLWGMGQATVRLVGGVELSSQPIPMSATPAAESVGSAISGALYRESATSVGSAQGADERIIYTTVPITTSSQEFIRQHPIAVHEGMTYAGDSKGVVRSAFDSFGNMSTYEYDKEERLTGVELSTPDDWRLRGAVGGNGEKSLSIKSPNGDDMAYRFNPEGRISRREVNGSPVERYSWSKSRESVSVERIETKEEYPIGDLSGKPRKVEKVVARETVEVKDGTFTYTREPLGREDRPETIKCVSSKDKVAWEGSGLSPVVFMKKGENVVVEESALGKVSYEYEPKGDLLKKVSYENGDYMEFSPKERRPDGSMIALRAKRGSAIAEVVISDSRDRVVSRDFGGRETTYNYKDGLLQEVASPLGKVSLRYDESRLAAIQYPDGSSLQFDMKEGASTRRLTVWREMAAGVR